MKLFVNAECHFQQLSDNFHFVFILAGDLPRLRVSRQLVENGRRSGKIGRKASLGFHFALQFACRRPMEEAEDRGAAQTCNDIHRRKRTGTFWLLANVLLAWFSEWKTLGSAIPSQKWYVCALWDRDVGRQDKENTKVKWDYEQDANITAQLGSLKVIRCSEEQWKIGNTCPVCIKVNYLLTNF